jgi:hypothetical protein
LEQKALEKSGINGNETVKVTSNPGRQPRQGSRNNERVYSLRIKKEESQSNPFVQYTTTPSAAQSYRDGLIKFTASNALTLQINRAPKIDGSKLKPLMS